MFPDDNNKIRIFPSSNRDVRTGRYGDNFVTEYNLSSLINKLLIPEINGAGTSTGFVISTSTGGKTNKYNASAEFNIRGYFIRVDSWNDIINNTKALNDAQTFVKFQKRLEKEGSPTEGDTITAAISIVNKEGENDLQEAYYRLEGQDNISTTSTQASSDNDLPTYTLPLLKYKGSSGDGEWIINPDAKLKFSNINIDDGRIS